MGNGPLDGLRAIIPRMTGGVHDDQIIHVREGQPVGVLSPTAGGREFVPLVATGTVEWVRERPIEVWVPQDRLAEWLEANPE